MIARVGRIAPVLFSLAAFAEPLTVTVTTVDGNPAVGAEVFCVRYHDHGCRTDPLPDEAQRITDERGQAQFDVKGVQMYILYARQGRFAANDRYYPNPEKDAGIASLQMEYARRITGIIRGGDGKPLEGVRIITMSTMPLGQTDSDGRYDIHTMGRYGSNNTWLYKPGYVATQFSFAFNFSTYDIVLTRGVPITGTVVWSDGTAATGANVKTTYMTVVAGENGAFEFPPQHFEDEVSLEASVHRIRQRAVTAKLNVDPRNGQPYELMFPFTERAALTEKAPMPEPPKAYISGRVLTKEGKPVRAQIVRVFDAGGRGSSIGQSDKDGHFRIPLTYYKGVFQLAANPISPVLCMMGEPKTIQPNPSKEMVVNFTVTDGAYIAGMIQDSAGNPIPQHGVTLHNGAMGIRQTRTTAQGRFAFPNIPLTRKPVTVGARFRGQRQGTVIELPPLKPGERRRNIVLKPTGNGARLRVLEQNPRAVFASYAERTQSSLVLRRQLAQVQSKPALESAKPNFVPVRIMVVDAEGKPVPDIGFQWDGPTSAFTSGVDGEILFYLDWTGSISWKIRDVYAYKYLYIDRFNNNLKAAQKIKLISANLKADAPGGLLDLRVVIERPTWRLTWGRVRLEGGAKFAPYAKANILSEGNRYRNDDIHLRNGWFLINELEDIPHAIEFQFDGYQPRVIANGIHYEVGDGPILVSLARGPMPKGISAWTAITGQPATQDAVDAFPAGEQVRQREREYYRTASAVPSHERKPGPTQQQLHAFFEGGRSLDAPKPPYRVRIVDEHGDPLNNVYYQGVGGQVAALPIITVFPPQLDRPFEYLRGDNGWFAFPRAAITIWADGKGFAWFPALQSGSSVPKKIVLSDAATVKILVRNWNGDPVANAIVGEFALVRMRQGSRLCQTTDENGVAIFENWSAGRQLFAVYRDRRQAGVHSFEVVAEPGKTVERTVVVGPWPAGSPPSVLAAWSQNRQFRVVDALPFANTPTHDWTTRRRDEREQLIRDLSDEDRAKIAQEVIRQITESPSVTRGRQQPSVSFLAGVAFHLKVREAATPLKQWLAGYNAELRHQPGTAGNRTDRPQLETLQHVAAAIIALDDGDTVSFFQNLAADPNARSTARACAVVALGQIGTDEAIEAWRALRDEAYRKDNSISPKDSYTHEQKMAESVSVTLYGIPLVGKEIDPDHPVPTTGDVQVDENYQYGFMRLGDAYSGSTRFGLRRFGEDWLVVWVGSTVIS